MASTHRRSADILLRLAATTKQAQDIANDAQQHADRGLTELVALMAGQNAK